MSILKFKGIILMTYTHRVINYNNLSLAISNLNTEIYKKYMSVFVDVYC